MATIKSSRMTGSCEGSCEGQERGKFWPEQRKVLAWAEESFGLSYLLSVSSFSPLCDLVECCMVPHKIGQLDFTDLTSQQCNQVRTPAPSLSSSARLLGCGLGPWGASFRSQPHLGRCLWCRHHCVCMCGLCAFAKRVCREESHGSINGVNVCRCLWRVREVSQM